MGRRSDPVGRSSRQLWAERKIASQADGDPRIVGREGAYFARQVSFDVARRKQHPRDSENLARAPFLHIRHRVGAAPGVVREAGR